MGAASARRRQRGGLYSRRFSLSTPFLNFRISSTFQRFRWFRWRFSAPPRQRWAGYMGDLRTCQHAKTTKTSFSENRFWGKSVRRAEAYIARARGRVICLSECAAAGGQTGSLGSTQVRPAGALRPSSASARCGSSSRESRNALGLTRASPGIAASVVVEAKFCRIARRCVGPGRVDAGASRRQLSGRNGFSDPALVGWAGRILPVMHRISG